jgi:hypothetical protein
MRIQSPLSNLRDVLSTVRESAKSYGQTLRNNEAATRAVLIDPVLRALGWDMANTAMVEVERTYGNKVRADYVLFDSNTTPCVVVEAKKLGTKLSTFEKELTQYPFAFKTSSAFITDGLVWRFYDNFDPTTFKSSWDGDIEKGDLTNIAAFLAQRLDAARFWPDDTQTSPLAQQLEKLQSDFNTLQQTVADLQSSVGNTPAAGKKGKVPSPPAVSNTKRQFVPLNQLVVTPANVANGSVTTAISGNKPAFLRLPDGKVIAIRTWREVLTETCKFVIENAAKLPIPYNDRAKRKVNLFSGEQPPPNTSHISYVHKGRVIYIYANYDALNCVENAIHALALLRPDQIKTEVAVAF